MSSAKIVYRDLSPKDEPYLRNMIGDAWEKDEYAAHPRLRNILLQHYLCYYLREQNFVRVATADGVPVGFLFGRSEKHPRPQAVRYTVQSAVLAAVLIFSPTGRYYLKNTHTIRKTDSRLLRHEHFGGELVLFAVDGNYREHGIGKHLLDDFKSYLEQDHLSEFFLFTDDYSDVDYYRARGYRQLAQTDVRLVREEDGETDRESKFYLFKYVLHEPERKPDPDAIPE